MSTDTRSHLGRLVRGGALNMAGAAISAVAGFVLVVLITNGYDKTTAGVLFSASSLFLVALSTRDPGNRRRSWAIRVEVRRRI